MCWIDTYLGPPDIIHHDAGTNFSASEFKTEAKAYGISCHQVPVEAHWSIGKVERYHTPLRRAHEILRTELTSAQMSPEAILQMAPKSVNDTVGPDGLVPTLLVFGAYPRITTESPPSASTIQRAKAIAKTMTELRKLMAKRKVNDDLNTRNGPNTEKLLQLPLGSEVCVYREKDRWIPYKIVASADLDVTVEMENGQVTFRSTAVRPYLRHPENIERTAPGEQDQSDTRNDLQNQPDSFQYPPLQQPCRRGRPCKNSLPMPPNRLFLRTKKK